jgi:hypothetical protein
VDASADVNQILDQLRDAGKNPKRSLLERVKSLGPAVVQPLIGLATDPKLLYGDPESREVWAPLHAINLLGELRATEAVGPLLSLFEMDDDWFDLALPEAFGRIGQPALPPLHDLLLDHAQDLYTRSRAASGLAEIAKNYPELRHEVVADLSALLGPLHFRDLEDDAELNGFIVNDLLDLKAKEAVPAIEQAFAADRVDETIVGDWSDVAEDLGLAPVAATAPVAALPPASSAPLPYRGPKVGRNEPCPCGSGKKYKKCCGR